MLYTVKYQRAKCNVDDTMHVHRSELSLLLEQFVECRNDVPS